MTATTPGYRRSTGSAFVLWAARFGWRHVVMIAVAAFALFGGVSREPAGGPAVNPWAHEPPVPTRVPATPSRGGMGLDVTGSSPRPVAARTAR